MSPEAWNALRQQYLDDCTAAIDAFGTTAQASGDNQLVLDEGIRTMGADHGRSFASFLLALRDANAESPPPPAP